MARKGHNLRVEGHARIPHRTERTAGWKTYVLVECKCGWHNRVTGTQETATDNYRAHLRSLVEEA